MADPLLSHQDDAFWENVEFLREQGMSEEQIAARLGVKKATLQRRRERKDKKGG